MQKLLSVLLVVIIIAMSSVISSSAATATAVSPVGYRHLVIQRIKDQCGDTTENNVPDSTRLNTDRATAENYTKDSPTEGVGYVNSQM